MVERQQGRREGLAVPTIGELITAYRDRTGASYRDIARKVRDEIHSSAIQKLVVQPPKSFAEARTMELLAEALDLPVATVVLGYAASLGIPVRDTAPELARRLPAGAADLSTRDVDAIIAVVKRFIEARNEFFHGARPETPGRPENDPADIDPDDYGLAARRGTSEGRRLREQQDRDAES